MHNTDICSILMIFSDGFSLFATLEFQLPYFYFPLFAPIGHDDMITHDSITMGNINILFMKLVQFT